VQGTSSDFVSYGSSWGEPILQAAGRFWIGWGFGDTFPITNPTEPDNKPHVTRGMLNLEQLRKLTC